MIIYTTNILATPLLILVWCIDLYLFLTVVRFIVERTQAAPASGLRLSLRRFTDYLPTQVHQCMQRRTGRPLHTWPSWAIVLTTAIVLRYVLLWILLRSL